MRALSFVSPVLAIEASTATGSVALWQHGALQGVAAVPMGVGREDQLFPAIQRLLRDAGLRPRDVASIVCGEGPGSFTSLRIAAALAKGLAHGAQCALYAVPSLLVAAATASPALAAGRYVVHSDALRGERYVLPIERSAEGRVIQAGPLARLTIDALQANVDAAWRIAVGGALIPGERAPVDPDISSVLLADGPWRESAVSLVDWEPVYGRLAEAQVKWEASHGRALPDVPLVSS